MNIRYIDANRLVKAVPIFLQNLINNMDCVYIDGIETNNQHFNLAEHDKQIRADERANVLAKVANLKKEYTDACNMCTRTDCDVCAISNFIDELENIMTI